MLRTEDSAVQRWVPTADQINSIKPDEVIGNRSGKWSGWLASIGFPARLFLTVDCQKSRVAIKQALENRSGIGCVEVELIGK